MTAERYLKGSRIRLRQDIGSHDVLGGVFVGALAGHTSDLFVIVDIQDARGYYRAYVERGGEVVDGLWSISDEMIAGDFGDEEEELGNTAGPVSQPASVCPCDEKEPDRVRIVLLDLKERL